MNAERINKLFREKGRSLGCAESFTGGLFASKVTEVPGASHFFKGGLVTYATEAKVKLLGIPYEELDKYGVVSAETAAAMSSRVIKLLDVDYAVSFTGNAGPEKMERKEAGEIYIGVSAYGTTRTYHYILNGERKYVQEEATRLAFELLEEAILENN